MAVFLILISPASHSFPSMLFKHFPIIVDSYNIIHNSLTENIQMFASPENISNLPHSIQSHICDINAWVTANMLKPMDSKVKLMLVTPKRRKHLGKNVTISLTINAYQISFNQSMMAEFTLHCNLSLHYTVILVYITL